LKKRCEIEESKKFKKDPVADAGVGWDEGGGAPRKGGDVGGALRKETISNLGVFSGTVVLAGAKGSGKRPKNIGGCSYNRERGG